MRRIRSTVAVPSRDLPLVTVCALVIGFGIWLRAQHLGFPHGLTWDEHHFVLNARAYLRGQTDLNDHPPLGKLLIAVPMRLFGDSSTTWRLAPLVFGLIAIGLSAWLAAWAAERRTAGWLGAALIAGDGFFIAYSRCALLDGMLACLLLAAMVVALRARSPLGIAVASLLVGSACSLKISGMVVLPALAWVALSSPAPVLGLLALLLAPVSFVAWFSLGLHITHHPAGVLAVVAETKRLYLHHIGLDQWKHPLVSHWYQWWLPTRPIPLRYNALPDGRVRVLTSLGNPLLWWCVDATVVVTAVRLANAAVRRWRAHRFHVRVDEARSFLETPLGRRAMLLLLWFLPLTPWIVTHRDSYIYHYLPAYGFGIPLAAVLLDRLYAKRRVIGLAAVLVIAEVSVYYAPLWGQLPINPQGVDKRLFLSCWR